MSAASLATRSRELTIEDLREIGFTEEQIGALSALKSAYPFVEYVDTAKQWGRLQFLKWRYEEGDLQRA